MAGIKPDGQLDLALVATEDARPVPVGAAFTANLLAAAPVQVCRAHLLKSGGLSAGVILNSGCANAATGSEGRLTSELTCDLAAEALGVRPEHFLVCSTGTIGTRLAGERIKAALPLLIGGRGSSPRTCDGSGKGDPDDRHADQGGGDRGERLHCRRHGEGCRDAFAEHGDDARRADDRRVVVITDAEHRSSQRSGHSFNEMTVDGCTSTNDSVIVMASGLGPEVEVEALAEALTAACDDLALQMVADAEGGTKVVRVRVVGASDGEAARRAARSVAESQLVKCSWYGEDPNWGRVLSELGSAGTPFDPGRVSIAYGPVTVCRDGVAVDHDEGALREVLTAKNFEITCDLGLGGGSATVISADLTPAYVELNKGMS